jgi:hypothetical protein
MYINLIPLSQGSFVSFITQFVLLNSPQLTWLLESCHILIADEWKLNVAANVSEIHSFSSLL